MLKKWFSVPKRGREETLTLWSPLSGKVIPMEEVPDPTFSKSSSTPGLAIEPAEGRVYAPFDGEIIWLFETKHALCIRSRSGVEAVIHVGLDTVSLRGEGFHVHVRNEERVQAGQLLMEFSLDLIGRKATSTVTPILIINPDRIEHLELCAPSLAQARCTPLMKIVMKS